MNRQVRQVEVQDPLVLLAGAKWQGHIPRRWGRIFIRNASVAGYVAGQCCLVMDSSVNEVAFPTATVVLLLILLRNVRGVLSP